MPSTFWLFSLIGLCLLEAISVGLVSIWFAVGALGALVVSAVTTSIWVQSGVFLVLSALSMLLLRPLAKKVLQPRYTPTNADRILGTTAVVIEEIDNLKATGLANVAGQVWTARSEGGAPIAPGTTVTIARIEGVKIFVKPA